MEIQEIKKGHTGSGLLIENDGFISSEFKDNMRLVEDITKDGGWHVPEPFIVDAVFQKFDIPNANNRIYPEKVLKSQVETYIEKYVKNKCSIGEADHPSCYPLSSPYSVPQILTLSGWKPLNEAIIGDFILTLVPETGVIEYKPILNTINEDYKGKLIHFKGRHISEYVTPNHKFPIYGRNGKFKGFYTAEQIMKHTIPDQQHSYIPKTGVWQNGSPDTFKLGEYEIPMDAWMKFMGIYLSEGCIIKTDENSNKVFLFQKKESVVELIKELLNQLPFHSTYCKNEATDTYTFTIASKTLRDYLLPLGDAYTKYIPMEIKDQSKENLRLLYDWFVLGDGRKRGNSDDVFSVSKQLALDLNEIQLKIGYSGSFHTRIPQDRKIEGREILAENSSPLHISYRSLSNGIYLDDRMIEIEEVDYDGKIGCIEVENHNWFVMVDGKCHWTGNSSSISSRTISHDILELHWEGNTLVGKLRLITSQGFRKFGIISCMGDMIANLILTGVRIGVSSRGMGSVEEHMGKYVVGDDYEIICWDIVTQPSTPNAWIGLNKKEIQPFIENEPEKLTDDEKKLFEKLDYLNNILI